MFYVSIYMLFYLECVYCFILYCKTLCFVLTYAIQIELKKAAGTKRQSFIILKYNIGFKGLLIGFYSNVKQMSKIVPWNFL